MTITLEQLLTTDELQDVTIRYVCAVRKMLLADSGFATKPELLKIFQPIEAYYHAIGSDRRSEAFNNGQYRAGIKKHLNEHPTEQYAEDLTYVHIERYLRDFLTDELEDGDELAFSFAQFAEYVSIEHLKDEELAWSEHDSSQTRQQGGDWPTWKNTIQNFLQRGKSLGTLAFSKRRQKWVYL